jgi:hypothetical protein
VRVHRGAVRPRHHPASAQVNSAARPRCISCTGSRNASRSDELNGVMAVYRIYALEADGHYKQPPHVIECENDDEAIVAAQPFINGKSIEVWDGDKLVVRLEA